MALLDQDGREVHFYSDLVKGNAVVINTIYTTCTTVCPPMGVNFNRLQKLLGDAANDLPTLAVAQWQVDDYVAQGRQAAE